MMSTKLWSLALFFLICIKQYTRFLYPGLFWPEDCWIFLKRSLVYGWHAIAMPYGGYMQCFPQLLSFLSTKAPQEAYPYLVLLECNIFFAMTLSLLLRDSFSWICPSREVRFLIAIALLFTPGLYEILGNYSNLHSVLLLYCVFVLLQNPQQNLKLIDIFVFFVTFLSAGESLILIPLLFVRSLLFGLKWQSMLIFGLLMLTFGIQLSAYYNNPITIGDTYGNPGLAAKWDVLSHFFPFRFLYTVFNRLFFIPLLGPHITLALNDNWRLTLWIGFGFTLICGLFWRRIWDKKDHLLSMALIGYVMLIIMTVLVRRGVWNTAWLGLTHELEFFEQRYFFMLTPIAILLWCRLFAGSFFRSTPRRGIVCCGVFCVYFMLINGSHFFIPAHQNEVVGQWTQHSDLYEGTLHKKRGPGDSR